MQQAEAEAYDSRPAFYNLEELEGLAAGKLPAMVMGYYAGGAGSQAALRENRASWGRYRVLPRMLRNVSGLSPATTLFGLPASFPVMVAPMAMHGMACPEGRELATAAAAAAAGVPFCFSTMATASLEELASTGHPGLIFQLYVVRDREAVAQWVGKAERLGYRAIMVTVDAQKLGRREADERNRFALPEGLRLKNLDAMRVGRQQPEGAPAAAAAAASVAPSAPAAAAAAPAPAAALLQARDTQPAASDFERSGIFKLFAQQVDDSLTWDFIPWLRAQTRLPIIVKGILHPDDARIAVACGVDGIVVSNHGGRQMDAAPAAIDVLPAVVEAVAGRVPVLVDGGVRRGTDVLTALALGASGVLLGRPVLYGLALRGRAGVEEVLALLRQEFELAMALAGCRDVASIGRDLVLLPPEAVTSAVLRRQRELLPHRRAVAGGGAVASAAGSGLASRLRRALPFVVVYLAGLTVGWCGYRASAAARLQRDQVVSKAAQSAIVADRSRKPWSSSSQRASLAGGAAGVGGSISNTTASGSRRKWFVI